MSAKLMQLLNQIRRLSPAEFAQLGKALSERRWTDDEWDRQIRVDAEKGELDHLVEQAKRDLRRGRTRHTCRI
jgi:hypothetical protein